jgi:1-acyl-sn-glycerol-3-phosphate acyltransferase
MKQRLYEWIFFKLMAWEIRGAFDPEIKKCVIMILPHTSWHDFYIGLFSRGIINLEMHYVAKKELFKFPFGAYFRWMGGAPLDRSGNQNKVDAIVGIFQKREIFRMAIAPEGTRRKVGELKSGFYYMAMKANVPILPVAFDYAKKEVGIGNYFYPTGNYESDMSILLSHFIGVKGKFPQKQFDIENFLQNAKP